MIVIEEESDGTHWSASWVLGEPVRELVFERQSVPFRARLFEVLTPGYRIQKRGDVEVLTTDGVPASTITVRFPEYSEWLEKEYEFFQTFSDGSVAIYTGHLVARPGQESDDCESCFIRAFRFVAQPGVSIIVDGERQPSPVDWFDAHGQGRYVYFGALEPVESEEMISVVDPALPDWLESETRRALPRLFEIYTKRLGVALPERPTILFSWDESEQPGTSSGGGTLPGQIQLTVHGTGWRERSDEAMLHLFHFLAHEAVHLWNGQVIHYPDSPDSWMHEGSAEALAERALLDLGLIDEERLLAYQTTALNACLRGIDGKPLREADRNRKFDLYYSCGNVLALVTEASMPAPNLFDFWRALIDRALPAGTYGAEDYFAVWSELGTREVWSSARRFVEESADEEGLLDLLERSGIATEVSADPPESYGQMVAREALFDLLGQHCRGAYGFYGTPEGLKLNEKLDCGAIPGGSVVTHVGGHHVLREGHRVGDRLHQLCGTDVPVELTLGLGSDSTVTVPLQCTTPTAPRPEYVVIRDR